MEIFREGEKGYRERDEKRGGEKTKAAVGKGETEMWKARKTNRKKKEIKGGSREVDV